MHFSGQSSLDGLEIKFASVLVVDDGGVFDEGMVAWNENAIGAEWGRCVVILTQMARRGGAGSSATTTHGCSFSEELFGRRNVSPIVSGKSYSSRG